MDNKYVKDAVSIIPNAIGGIAGGAVGGPGGVVLGVTLSQMLQRVGKEMYQRFLGPREDYRVGSAIELAVQKIEELLSQGKVLRPDWFGEDYDISQKKRMPVEEILESFLLKSQRRSRRKEIAVYGKFVC